MLRRRLRVAVSAWAVVHLWSCGARTSLDANRNEPQTDATWTPMVLQSRLVFWFAPESLTQIAGKVLAWRDMSGNHNDASQPITEYAPAYTADGIHGLASATFTGPITFLSIADAATMRWGTSDFVVLAVVRATSQTAPDAMIYQKTSPPPYDGLDLYLNAAGTTRAASQVSGYVYVVSAPPPATFVDGSVHVVGAHRVGTTLEVRIDGVLSGSKTGNAYGANVDAVGAPGVIGQNGYGAPPFAEFQQLHGDVAEIIGVMGTVTPTELATLEAYLKSRYAVP